MMKVPVRIAVVAGSNGDYFAHGQSRSKDSDNFDACLELISEEGYKTGRRYFVEAVIEVPDGQAVVQGKATPAELRVAPKRARA